MFRHVVMFRWSPEATDEQRQEAHAALSRLAGEVAGLGRLTFGPDAGLAEGNFDVAVVADFPDRGSYLAYAEHPAHIACVTSYLRPILSQRTAVQYELPAS